MKKHKCSVKGCKESTEFMIACKYYCEKHYEPKRLENKIKRKIDAGEIYPIKICEAKGCKRELQPNTTNKLCFYHKVRGKTN